MPIESRSPFHAFAIILRYRLFSLEFLCLILLGICSPSAKAGAWQIEREWTPAEEDRFSQWVSQIGAHAWRSVNHLLQNANSNPFYDANDKDLILYADCADLPVILRAYYSYKRHLPFAFPEVSGGRYGARGNTTSRVLNNLSHEGSVKDFFRQISETTHTGSYRTEPNATDSLTYPIAITPESVRPGALFYSPEGHVALIAEVTSDGSIYMIDAHPDQTITRIRFSEKLVWRSAARVGGFKRFRPVVIKGDKLLLTQNEHLSDFSDEQYAMNDYYGELRHRLTSQAIDPLAALERSIRDDIFSEVLDRIQAVELGWAVGRVRSIAIPSNIYTAEGDWENFSTPSRDLRLRRAFLQLPEEIRGYLRLCRDFSERLSGKSSHDPRQLGADLLKRKERLFKELKFYYENTSGKKVTLSLAELERRLFLLSFDPNHPPELRWGATGRELESARRLPAHHFSHFESQQRWRNRLEKKEGPMAISDADNPSVPHLTT